jgi:hypothetical protein
MSPKLFPAALALLAGLAAPAAARPYHLGPIRVAGLSAEPIGGGAYAVYGPILNIGVRADAITLVASPAARAARIVRPRADPSLAPRIALPPGRTVTLTAWTPHIELDGVVLPPGATIIPITVHFDHAGTLKASASLVRPVQAPRPAIRR